MTQPATGSDEAGLGKIFKQKAGMGLEKSAKLYVDGASMSPARPWPQQQPKGAS